MSRFFSKKNKKFDPPAPARRGHLIGHVTQNGEALPVSLPPEALADHTLVVGGAGTGKTTTISHLTAAAMQSGAAVVVIDSKGDLVQSLLGRVPKERVPDTYLLDWTDDERAAGLNWLDTSQGFDAQMIVSTFVHAGPRIWRDAWGPRLEDMLRFSLRTLLEVNQILVEQREEQFTLLDLVELFQLPDFRLRLLKEFVLDRDIQSWWTDYFEPLPDHIRMDLEASFLAPIRQLDACGRLKMIVCQSTSTVPFYEVPERGLIFLVKRKPLEKGGAGDETLAMLLVHGLFTSADRQAAAKGREPKRVVVVLDGAESIAELEMVQELVDETQAGISLIVSAESIGPDADNQALFSTMFSQVGNLFVFRTTKEDARILESAFEGDVSAESIQNQPNYRCLVRSRSWPRDVGRTIATARGQGSS